MISHKKLIFVFSVIITVFVLLGVRCFYLQVLKNEYYRNKFQQQEKLTVEEHAQRGVIVDTRGRYLAVSKPVETVFADPMVIKDYKEAAGELQGILDMPGHEICELITSKPNSRFVRIKKEITPEEREAVKLANIYGIGITKEWKRDYPMGPLFSHVVGLEAVKREWCEGVENRYYDLLTGIEGKKTFIVDTFRKPIGVTQEQSMPLMGTSLILTLDATIQKIAREAVIERCKEYEAEAGMAVVIRPETGEVLAMSCYPDYDPRDASEDPSFRRNRLLTDPFEPGSIFKPIFTSIALDAGIINKNTKIDCENGFYSGRGFGKIEEYNRHSYGNLTPREILIHSSNIGMAKMGQIMDRKLGKQKMYDYIKLFGFGSKTGIDLPGECEGILNPLSRWNGYSVTRIPYGQEICVTSIQIASAYCTLANHGRPVVPYVVKAFVDSNGQQIKINRINNTPGYIIDPEIADWIVQEALVDVVKDGTGTSAALDDYTVFGKTGTANIAVNGTYDDRSYVASFAGGAPAEKPEVIVVVSIRKPNRSLGKGYTGGRVSGPVVGKIIKESLDYLHSQN